MTVLHNEQIDLIDYIDSKAGTVIAYTRVSDKFKQSNETQLLAIEDYAKANGLRIDKRINFNLSGSKTTKTERGLDSIIEGLKAGDKLVITDVARLGRDDPMDLMMTIKQVVSKGAELHLAYTNKAITSMGTDDMGTLFMMLGESIAAVKFAEERSRKATVACKRRRESGLHNGRKVGTKVKSKLDDQAVFIIDELGKGTAKTKLVALLADRGIEVSRSQLYRFIDTKLDGNGIAKA